MAGGTAFLIAAAWTLGALNGSANPLQGSAGPDLVIPVGTAAVGAVVVARQKENRIGWLFLATGFVDAIRGAVMMYALLGLRRSTGLPAVDWVAWASNWDLFPLFPAGTYLFCLLLFPDGRLPTSRWQLLAWATVPYNAVVLLGTLTDPRPIELANGLPTVTNPVGVRGFPLAGAMSGDFLWPMGLVLLAFAGASVVARYRRSDGDVRHVGESVRLGGELCTGGDPRGGSLLARGLQLGTDRPAPRRGR